MPQGLKARGASLGGPSQIPAGAMQVKIGKVAAVCPVCKRTEFRSPVEQPNQMDVLTCAKCGTKYTYVFLLDQIARQSIAQSDDALSASRNRKPPDKT